VHLPGVALSSLVAMCTSSPSSGCLLFGFVQAAKQGLQDERTRDGAHAAASQSVPLVLDVASAVPCEPTEAAIAAAIGREELQEGGLRRCLGWAVARNGAGLRPSLLDRFVAAVILRHRGGEEVFAHSPELAEARPAAVPLVLGVVAAHAEHGGATFTWDYRFFASEGGSVPVAGAVVSAPPSSGIAFDENFPMKFPGGGFLAGVGAEASTQLEATARALADGSLAQMEEAGSVLAASERKEAQLQAEIAKLRAAA